MNTSHQGLEVPKVCNVYVCPLCMLTFEICSQARLHMATHPWHMLAPFGWSPRRLMCKMSPGEDRLACFDLLTMPPLQQENENGYLGRYNR